MKKETKHKLSRWWYWNGDLIIALAIAALLILITVLLIVCLAYKSSCAEAKIYNQLNNTNYTCSEFFWAGEQINQQTQTIKLK